MNNNSNLDEIIAHRIAGIPEEEANRVRDEASSSTKALQRKVARAEAGARAAEASVTQWQNSYHNLEASLTQWQEAYRNLEGQLQEANSSHQRSRLVSLWNRFNNWIRPQDSSFAEQFKSAIKVFYSSLITSGAIAGMVIGAYFGISDIVRKPDTDSVMTYDLNWSDVNDAIRPYVLIPSNLPKNAVINCVFYDDRTNTIDARYSIPNDNNAYAITSSADEQSMDSIISHANGYFYAYFLDSAAIQKLDSRGDLRALAALVLGGWSLYQPNASGNTPINPGSTIDILYNFFKNADSIEFFAPNHNSPYEIQVDLPNNQLIYLNHLVSGAQEPVFTGIGQLLGDKP
ncbi:MAG: hypothetical protein EPN88_07770 [Bacteroidetes bacterium]|nr:MAG: hypothetical protein EPN88_07770 [Bacteroidota bacterium]